MMDTKPVSLGKPKMVSFTVSIEYGDRVYVIGGFKNMSTGEIIAGREKEPVFCFVGGGYDSVIEKSINAITDYVEKFSPEDNP